MLETVASPTLIYTLSIPLLPIPHLTRAHRKKKKKTLRKKKKKTRTHFFFLSSASIFSSSVPTYLLNRSTAFCRACTPFPNSQHHGHPSLSNKSNQTYSHCRRQRFEAAASNPPALPSQFSSCLVAVVPDDDNRCKKRQHKAKRRERGRERERRSQMQRRT